MKRTKKVFAIVFSAILVVQLFTISAFASERKDESIITMAETRSASEMNNLRSIYAQLFPNEYHYIEEYEKNGVKEMDASEVKMIFHGSEDINTQSYDLIVMNNGQIFTNISDLAPTSDNPHSRLTVTTTGEYTVGDLGHYNTFKILYTVNYSGYDWINSCDNISGSGFYLYPTNLSKKWNEDADGPAHYSYNNVSMNSDGSGVLYDIGVAVGNDKAKGVTQVSTGADMWLWAFLYGLFF